MSFIALSGIIYLADELIMTLYCYAYNLQPYTIVFVVRTATKILNYAPKYGLTE